MPTEQGGAHVWPFVELVLHEPIFFILAKARGERRKKLVMTTTAVEDTFLVEGFQRIDWVKVITPPWVNGSLGWRMEELVELWDIVDPESGGPGKLYVVDAGTVYLDVKDANHKRMTRLRCIFPPSRRSHGDEE